MIFRPSRHQLWTILGSILDHPRVNVAPSWDHFWAIMGSTLDLPGISFVSLRNHPGIMLGSSWDKVCTYHFGIILGSCLDQPGIIFGSSWDCFCRLQHKRRMLGGPGTPKNEENRRFYLQNRAFKLLRPPSDVELRSGHDGHSGLARKGHIWFKSTNNFEKM